MVVNISDFDYPLPDERIARFPLPERDRSRLLVWRQSGEISEGCFSDITSKLPRGSLLVFNNTKVVRARLVMHKSVAEMAGKSGVAGADNKGARIEILCLEPHLPADHERAFASHGSCEWRAMIGGSKRWKGGALQLGPLRAHRGEDRDIVRFSWDGDTTFGELLELLGRMPIPPYLGRDSEEIDLVRYQTVYSRFEGSVAAPTAGLHFTPGLIGQLEDAGVETDEVTLHVGAGTFLPVKVDNALDHPMHTEHFEVTLRTIEHLLSRFRQESPGPVIAVGTTSVRTLESLPVLALRIWRTGGAEKGSPHAEVPVGQFEHRDIPYGFDGRAALEILAEYMKANGLDKLCASTQIMITPGFTFRIVGGIVTNFHQPKSTLLLLIAAFTGGGSEWRRIYDHALTHGFRFLSYGDSSLLLR